MVITKTFKRFYIQYISRQNLGLSAHTSVYTLTVLTGLDLRWPIIITIRAPVQPNLLRYLQMSQDKCILHIESISINTDKF